MKRKFVAVALLILSCVVLPREPRVYAQGLMPSPLIQFSDANGDPLNGGKLCSYASSTTTPLATYSDAALLTPRTNPVVLDSAGRATGGGIYLSAANYKLILLTAGSDATCATGTTVWSIDPVASTLPWNGVAFAGKVTYSAATVLTVASNAVLPTQNVHAIDTPGGAANLQTITTTNTVPGFILYLTANNGGANAVTVRTGLGNIVMSGGDYLMNASSSWITLMLKGTTWYEVARAGGSVLADNAINRFRATLTSGTCVTTTDVLAATTIYWSPCDGNIVSLYDGVSQWNLRSSAELSIAVPAAASTLYDLFVYDNAGTPTLELTAWTNDTTRATALTTQSGILVKSGATTRRYLASVRTTAVAGQVEDSIAKRYLWNYYHREQRVLYRSEQGSWTYTTPVWRQAAGGTTNTVDLVVGVVGPTLDLHVNIYAANTVALAEANIAFGIDSATVPHTAFVSTPSAMGGLLRAQVAAATAMAPLDLTLIYKPPIGRHFYTWLEWSGGAGVQSWTGAFINVTPSGIHGWIEG